MSSPASDSSASQRTGSLILRHRAWVAPLCWVAVLLDGFDAVVLGAVMPSMIDDPDFGLTAASGTVVATVGLVGMMIGALAMGWATDRFGRRKLLMGAVLLFSAFTLGMAFVDSIFLFGLLRFLAGLGLGGCLPTGISMVTEFAGKNRTGKSTTLMMTGYHVGAVATAALAIVVVQNINWHAMFIIGALPAVVLVPLMYVFLPESPDYLLSKGRVSEARAVAEHYGLDFSDQEHREKALADAAPDGEQAARKGAGLVLQGQFRRNTIFVWIASFMGLLLVYGLNTWLPQIMRAADYDLGNALGFLLILNIGAVVGLLIAGRTADRITPRNAGIIWFIGAGVLLAALAVQLPLVGIYAMIFVTGCFVFSAQVLVYAFCAANYLANVRATALGMSAGVGRLGAISGPSLGGAMLAAGIAYPWGFFGFAAAALLGGAALAGTKTLRDGETG
ncbi:aromatic acid/H+ symport family MFS transporter [Kocuria coralli]|uniref:Aromatic acid/H+ symport family MFS transporter n=1 Tax=Kocuria coralli TaxID=1461025 RepID=A0A5J5KYJ7_9MICC|nr:aromatic acid/H+ symport family MFS transporter [Kocuria coralli]KAA9393811.1 aromatic acid/H+ symport family MFS transporter [Kocuria coralli]